MTAAKTKSTEPGRDALDDLRAEAAELAGGIGTLAQSIADSRQQREALKTERGTLVLPARSGKDKGAQSRLHAIDEQLAVLNRDIEDDDEARVELKAQLTLVEREISLGEWEKERARVRALLVELLNSKKSANLQKMARDLVAALKEIEEDQGRVSTELASFDSRLRVRVNRESCRRILAWDLADALPGDALTFAERASRGRVLSMEGDFSTALEALDRLELVF